MSIDITKTIACITTPAVSSVGFFCFKNDLRFWRDTNSLIWCISSIQYTGVLWAGWLWGQLSSQQGGVDPGGAVWTYEWVQLLCEEWNQRLSSGCQASAQHLVFCQVMSQSQFSVVQLQCNQDLKFSTVSTFLTCFLLHSSNGCLNGQLWTGLYGGSQQRLAVDHFRDMCPSSHLNS